MSENKDSIEKEAVELDFDHKSNASDYTEADFETLSWNEHIRRRSGMYIGKLGDGSSPDDGIYVLLKEIIDNAIDEFKMGYGKSLTVEISGREVIVRDYGRGIPFGKLIDAVSKMNTGAKYGSSAFKKSVGLNGVGTKAVNATSSSFYIETYRDNQCTWALFERGYFKESGENESSERNGTMVRYTADPTLYENYSYNMEFVETMVKNYTYLNKGLSIVLNGDEFKSRNGLLDLIHDNLSETPLYDPIYLSGDDIEIVMTHGSENGENISSFVNGQNTIHGGTHLAAFRGAGSKTIKDFFKKDFDPRDIRQSIIGAISINVEEPKFSNQTKTYFDAKDVAPGGPTVRNFIVDFISEHLDNFLHKNPSVTDAILKKIVESEKERKAISGIQKLARERAKKANLHNRKLRDCRVHLCDQRGKDEAKNMQIDNSSIFITEGDSASGSITKSRDVNTQAVFSLRGKPLNCYGLTRKVVYENEEFNLLQAALDIEEGLDSLRYNHVIIATDADVDGMHIRLLIISFFLQFFPELVKSGHVQILQTPLFRVRNKKKTLYCYSDAEREKAIKELGPKPEITRFKGLGEISPDEFRHFIGKDIRLEPVQLRRDDAVKELLDFYMGKNTQSRQNFIIGNLVVE